MPFSNYSNPYSVEQIPKKANKNEYVPFLEKSFTTEDLALDPKDNTKIVCVNEGKWSFAVQYQLVGLKNVDKARYGTINGWIALNGIDIPNSDASASVVDKEGSNVLVISLTGDIKKGDVIQFGVRSTSKCKKPNTVCKGFIPETRVFAPSVILTFGKLPDV